MKYLLLCATLSAAAFAQTAPAPKPAAAPKASPAATTGTAPRKTAAAGTRKPGAVSTTKSDPAFNPPGVPAVTGTPTTLYALSYIDIKVGDGPLAESEKFYTVHYTGWLPNGTKFDSSVDRGQPFVFPYGARRVIAGWDTGFEGMHIGGKRRLLIPWQLAYGETGRGPIPAKSPLIFDMELIGQSDTPPAPAAPPAPATPPPASTTEQPK